VWGFQARLGLLQGGVPVFCRPHLRAASKWVAS